MKQLFTLLSICVSTLSFAQSNVRVDEIQELSAIVWRLAECEEYNTRMNSQHLSEIETWFADFKEHPVMDFIRDMRAGKDTLSVVAYNSVPMSGAALLIHKGKVRLNPDVNLSEYIQNNDSRWSEENFRKYVKLLDDFYRKSNFRKFYEGQSELYASYIEDMETLCQNIIEEEWFQQFYGMELPEISVIVSPASGINNYALNEDMMMAMGKSGIGALIGVTYNPQKSGINQGSTTQILIHEISHYFTNKIFFPEYTERLTAAGTKIFEHLSEPLTAVGYGAPQIICPEYLNDLCMMMYNKEVLGSSLTKEVRECYWRGFIWAEEGVRYMENFSENRDHYESFSDFMPQLVGFMEGIADNIVAMKKEFYTPPYIVTAYPANGSTVSADISEIIFRFSQPMETGITALELNEEAELFIDDTWYDTHDDEPEYWKDEYTYVIRVGKKLESGKKYGVVIPSALYNKKGINTADDYVYEFYVK